ncbi:hypothetical protein [Paludibacterium purpuratum]|uniref:Uncharacterized protein n=1 Tax=Paludibacterium purpuratum TaxID=1144873 RepID=A0A4V6PZB9_9NEIS|nr:hypothetical protein [Paludibacterium purpuratum]TDR82759.1 hypothetical protein DFP86_101148 [Paludibacterium purpuratum]
MKPPAATAATLSFRRYFFRQSLILSLVFVAMNGVTLLRGSQAVQAVDLVRLVVASVVGGCLGALAMWLLRRRKPR